MIPGAIGALLAMSLALAKPVPVPWAVGEVFEYGGKYKIFPAGAATMKVVGVENVRGVPSWHFALTMDMNVLFYHQHTEMDSWTSTDGFISRRFLKVLSDETSPQNHDYRIFGDSGFYRDLKDKDTAVVMTPHDALDDIAFIYYLRTIPFKVGGHYQWPRYFRNDKNPVFVDVIGKEIIDMPDGSRVQTLVLHPVVNENHGMFNKDHDARIWMTDDGRRIPVRIRSSYPGLGALYLNIRSITMPVSPSR